MNIAFQEVSVLLMSNILIIISVLIAIFAIMYNYSDIKNSMDFFSYLQQNFKNTPSPKTEKTPEKEEDKKAEKVEEDKKANKDSDKPNNNILGNQNYANFMQNFNMYSNQENKNVELSIILQPQTINFFKYPGLLGLLTIMYVILFGIQDSKEYAFHRNAHIITPFLLVVYLFIAYKSYFSSYIEIKRGSMNKIKSIFLFMCIFTTIINLYIHDPGNFIENNFAKAIIFMIVIMILLMIYTGIDFVQGWKFKKQSSGTTMGGGGIETESSFSLLLKNPVFQLWNFVFNMIVFFTLIMVTAYYYNIKEERHSKYIYSLVSTFFISAIWFSFTLYLFFNKNENIESSSDPSLISQSQVIEYTKLALVALMIITFASFLIYQMMEYTSDLTTIGKVCVAVLICTILSVIYKYAKAKYNLQNSKAYSASQILLNIIFFIPCLIPNIYDFFYQIVRFILTGKKTPAFDVFNDTDYVSLGITASISILIIAYTLFKRTKNQIVTQNGKVLINQPVYLNKTHYLGSYVELNDQTEKNLYHNYAISFWIYMHSTPGDRKTNQSSSQDYYASLLNVSDKPNILYNSHHNNLIITYDSSLNNMTNTETEKFNEKVILFKTHIMAQKWNHILLNFDSGKMDLFINGELEYTNSMITPFNDKESMTVGEKNGADGGICNVVYFNRSLNVMNIFALYNSVKDRQPPVSDTSSKTIMDDIMEINK